MKVCKDCKFYVNYVNDRKDLCKYDNGITNPVNGETRLLEDGECFECGKMRSFEFYCGSNAKFFEAKENE